MDFINKKKKVFLNLSDPIYVCKKDLKCGFDVTKAKRWEKHFNFSQFLFYNNKTERK